MRISFPLLLATIAAACSSSPATQFTVGVISQISVPRDLRSVRITASVNGDLKFCQTYPVDDGKTNLPQSLALAPDRNDATRSVTITVVGFDKTKDDVMNVVADECSDRGDAVAAPARILRRSRQTYARARNLYVPMPLRYSCYGVECKAGESCRGGACTADIDAKVLPDYASELLFGDTSACFDERACLGDAVGPTVIDAGQCVYEVPPGVSARDVGMNVRAVYEGHGVEVLDLDEVEGFFIPDPTKPNRFKLAPGLCHPAPGGRKIVNVNASRTCASKNVFQPLCAASGKALAPATSALYILLDRESSMSEYVGAAAQPSQALDQVLGVALGDPVFSSTTQIAFKLVPTANACTDVYSSPDQPFKPVWAAAAPITQAIRTTATSPFTEVAADRIFSTAHPPLTSLTVANKRVLLLVTNRDASDAGGKSCSSSVASVIASNATARVDTYVLSLRSSGETPAATQTRRTNVQSLASAGAKVISAEGPDPQSSQTAVIAGLSGLVGDLAACVYEAPAPVDPAKTEIYLKPPGPAPAITIPHSAACAPASNAEGWNMDGALLRVCGAACTKIRDAIATANQLTALKNTMSATEGQQVLVFTRPK